MWRILWNPCRLFTFRFSPELIKLEYTRQIFKVDFLENEVSDEKILYQTPFLVFHVGSSLSGCPTIASLCAVVKGAKGVYRVGWTTLALISQSKLQNRPILSLSRISEDYTRERFAMARTAYPWTHT